MGCTTSAGYRKIENQKSEQNESLFCKRIGNPPREIGSAFQTGLENALSCNLASRENQDCRISCLLLPNENYKQPAINQLGQTVLPTLFINGSSRKDSTTIQTDKHLVTSVVTTAEKLVGEVQKNNRIDTSGNSQHQATSNAVTFDPKQESPPRKFLKNYPALVCNNSNIHNKLQASSTEVISFPCLRLGLSSNEHLAKKSPSKNRRPSIIGVIRISSVGLTKYRARTLIPINTCPASSILKEYNLSDNLNVESLGSPQVKTNLSLLSEFVRPSNSRNRNQESQPSPYGESTNMVSPESNANSVLEQL
jgi:hypothetical protein